jgi:DNA mismatch endonuclease (patch repair protein)
LASGDANSFIIDFDFKDFGLKKVLEVMLRIKESNTKPELAVRSLLHRMGYRFRLHKVDLPGKPDIVLSRYKTVIFVHGCFWHRHKDCRFPYTPKSRTEFWLKKLESNVVRDNQVKFDLELSGWRVITVWECELRELDQLAARMDVGLKQR